LLISKFDPSLTEQFHHFSLIQVVFRWLFGFGFIANDSDVLLIIEGLNEVVVSEVFNLIIYGLSLNFQLLLVQC
jgi:hypothetical protein